MIDASKVRSTSSQYGPYSLGYKRVTMVFTKRCNYVSMSKSLKNILSDYSLEVKNMKLES